MCTWFRTQSCASQDHRLPYVTKVPSAPSVSDPCSRASPGTVAARKYSDVRESIAVYCERLSSKQTLQPDEQSRSKHFSITPARTIRHYSQIKHTRSESTITDKKSGIKLERSSSYECRESANVYRIAAMTVALTDGSSSLIRAYFKYSTSDRSKHTKEKDEHWNNSTNLELRQVSLRISRSKLPQTSSRNVPRGLFRVCRILE